MGERAANHTHRLTAECRDAEGAGSVYGAQREGSFVPQHEVTIFGRTAAADDFRGTPIMEKPK